MDVAVAKAGKAPEHADMRALFETVIKHVPAPVGDSDGPFQLQISALDYSSYVGRLGIGRIRRGRIAPGQEVAVLNGPLAEGEMPKKAKIGQLFSFSGMERVPIETAEVGDIVLVTGVEELSISTTLTADRYAGGSAADHDRRADAVDVLQVNTSPLAGREGKYVTSRNLRDASAKEMLTNMALRVEETGDTDAFWSRDAANCITRS